MHNNIIMKAKLATIVYTEMTFNYSLFQWITMFGKNCPY